MVVVLELSVTRTPHFLMIQNNLWPNCKIFGHIYCVGGIDTSSYIESPNLVPKLQDRFWALGMFLRGSRVKTVHV